MAVVMGGAPEGIDVDDPWEAIEACYREGWTDGLPVVPPTEALVEKMLSAGPWAPDHVLLYEPVRARAVSAAKAAINAVMAGCRPEYLPVLLAAVEAMADPAFNPNGVRVTARGAGASWRA
ncbi:MAG TPA: hypothetical protein VED18_10065, partial [Candidatus Sulfotelmatobacter sp.]|nr:hypothetical protein [Candidatus Sulfotelmatobacter sp.]